MNKAIIKRVISGLVMLGIISLLVFLGQTPLQYAIYFIGYLVIDEILTNFLKIERGDFLYLFNILFYSSFLYFGSSINSTFIAWLYSFIIILKILYTFNIIKIDTFHFKSRMSFLFTCFICFPVLILSNVVGLSLWPFAFLGLISISISNDVGAWLIGRSFGKKPLYKSISPNKTVEGALGGIVITLIIGAFYFVNFLNEKLFPSIAILLILSVLSILGDLFESKLKRLYAIKDSSQLIPGHGGVYDRVDSVLFVASFYYLYLS